jgi:hypothetical protein
MTAERLSITISESCAQKIRELAKQNKTTVSAEIRAALKTYIEGTMVSEKNIARLSALDVRLRSVEQRIKDKDEIIKSKDEIIKSKDETIALLLDMGMPFKKESREKVIFSDDLPKKA